MRAQDVLVAVALLSILGLWFVAIRTEEPAPSEAPAQEPAEVTEPVEAPVVELEPVPTPEIEPRRSRGELDAELREILERDRAEQARREEERLEREEQKRRAQAARDEENEQRRRDEERAALFEKHRTDRERRIRDAEYRADRVRQAQARYEALRKAARDCARVTNNGDIRSYGCEGIRDRVEKARTDVIRARNN